MAGTEKRDSPSLVQLGLAGAGDDNERSNEAVGRGLWIEHQQNAVLFGLVCLGV